MEYRGVKTKEEKGLEQIVSITYYRYSVWKVDRIGMFDYIQEEQRVIDAKIRKRLQEIKDEEERMQRRQVMSSSNTSIGMS